MLKGETPTGGHMQNPIIGHVLAKMRGVLSLTELTHLEGILEEELRNYQLVQVQKENIQEQIKLSNVEILDCFVAAKRIEGCSEKTLSYYRNTIIPWLSTVPKDIKEISTNDVRQYLAEAQANKKIKRSTVDNIRRVFSSFFSWLEEDYIVKSPVRRIHKIKTEIIVKETISEEQLEILRNSCSEKRDLAMVDFLASTGVRVGELASINISDINFPERQCTVIGKGNKERLVYFSSRAKINLQNYLSSRTDSEKALFVSFAKPNNRLSISAIETRIRKLGKKASIGRIYPHKFRRTLATIAIDKGMPIEQVKCLLGHVKIDTTMHYAMVEQNNVKASHRKYIS